MLTVQIKNDSDCNDDPRSWDNMGTMVCFHGRYNLGDKKTNDNDTTRKLQSLVSRKDVIALPLYMYDHSGITIATKPFHCPWDSGQIGHIYVTKERARKELCVSRLTAKQVDRVLAILQGEVDTYDMYLRGDVYYYTVKDENGEVVDSCGGFYGKDGIAEIRSQFNDETLYKIETAW